MKKIVYLIIGIIIGVIGVLMILRGFNGGEDNWIKNENGTYVKHGNPDIVPNEVNEQEIAIVCAKNLYLQANASGMQFNSQCLGRCLNYSVDVVNVPRNEEDDIPPNQCPEFLNKITNHFIELNKDGDVVRIV